MKLKHQSRKEKIHPCNLNKVSLDQAVMALKIVLQLKDSINMSAIKFKGTIDSLSTTPLKVFLPHLHFKV